MAEPEHEKLEFCEGWRGWTMVEREGPLWLYGAHRVELELAAPGSTRASIWADGRIIRTVTVARRETVAFDLSGERWHSLVLDIPRMFLTNPPQGLTIARIHLG